MAVLIGEAPPVGARVDKGLFSGSGIAAPAGVSAVVTPAFGGETAGANNITPGIVTTPPDNLVRILDQNNDEIIHTATGSKVIGRITFGGGVWTLSYFFMSSAGVETAIANISTDTTLGAGLTDLRMAGVPKVFAASDPARPTLERAAILEAAWALDYILKTIQDVKLATSPLVDFKVVGTTPIYTVPAGKTAVIMGIALRCTAATAITNDAFAGVGIAAGEDDIFPPQTLVNFRAANKVWLFGGGGLIRTAPAASVIKLGVDTGAIGTTLQGVADVLGYLF